MYGFNCSDLYVNITFCEGAVNWFLLCACYYKNEKTVPIGTAFNVYKFIAITPVRWEQSLFFSEPLKLRERQSMRELR